MNMPKISIIIPAFNAANYLSEAIESALSQSYPNVEIIVVNDGSNDNDATRNIALSYKNRIRYFEKENGGSSSALNVGIENMTGEWFSWLSHDDLYVPEKLEKQIERMNSLSESYPELSKHIFFSASELIDANGKVIRRTNIKKEKKLSSKINSFPHNGYLIAEPTAYLFHGCSCLIHKDAFTNIGKFDEKLKLLNDVDFWFRLYSSGYKVHYIPEVLVRGRVHAKQVSKSIGYSYHNPEQDMYWNRSLDWLLKNYPKEDSLFLAFARNAYLKTRNAEGDCAMTYVDWIPIKKKVFILFYKCYASLRNVIKIYFFAKIL